MKLVIITVVIGVLLVTGIVDAKAQLAEQQRKQNGNSGKSPLPAGKYDRWRGEESLINPTRNSLDSVLSVASERFAKSENAARADMRKSISLDEFYTLLTFSERSAVF